MGEDYSKSIHEFRVKIDECIEVAKYYKSVPELSPLMGREMALVFTKLQEAKMWAGKCLEQLGSKLPEEFRDEVQPTK